MLPNLVASLDSDSFQSDTIRKACRFACQFALRLLVVLLLFVGSLVLFSSNLIAGQQDSAPVTSPFTPPATPATVPSTTPASPAPIAPPVAFPAAPVASPSTTPTVPTPAVPAPAVPASTAPTQVAPAPAPSTPVTPAAPAALPPTTPSAAATIKPFRASFSKPKQENQSGMPTSPLDNTGSRPAAVNSPFATSLSPTRSTPSSSAFSGSPSANNFARPQPASAATQGRTDSNFQATLGSQTNTAAAVSSLSTDSSQSITKVSKSFSKLPSTAGQVWREYDITPYTSRITSVEDPQQAIVDWILLETGTDMWFHQPLGILSANRHKLFVYHTPEIQAVVNRIVDRMVNTRGQLQSISVNLLTIANPNWRTEAYPVMQPIDVRSPGVEAWMVSKENAAHLLANLRRRPDFQEHGNARLVHHDGQPIRVEKYKPLQFVQSIRWTPNQVPGYQPQLKTINEGYALELASLTSLDGKTIEATVECSVDQVEKLRSVKIAIPSAENTTGAQVNLQIPQMVSWEIKERFRWPNDQVLVLSCGVVANLKPKTNNSLIPDLFEVDRGRADALLFIEYRGPDVAQLTAQPQPAGLAPVQRRQ